MSLFSEYLIKARERAVPTPEPGMGRTEAARAIGVNRMSLILWESGGGMPEERRLPDIARALQVDEAELRALWEQERAARKGRT